MPLNRNVTEVTGGLTAKQVSQAINALKTLKTHAGAWRKVASDLGGKFDASYLLHVSYGDKPPSRRLLLALGIVKPERRNGIRVRMSAEEAREIVDYGTIPADVVNRIGYQLWGVK